MRVRLRKLTLTRGGNPSVHEECLDVPVLTIGRGTDNDVQIPGLAVPLHHAACYDRPDGIHIEPRERRAITLNGAPVRTDTVLSSGDVVSVGQFDVRVLPPEPGERLALEIERVRDDAAGGGGGLATRTRLGIERGLFTRRKLSWLAVAAVLVVGLALPLATNRERGGEVDSPGTQARLAWMTGPVSRVHSFVAADCRACHAAPFAPVRDQECRTCHATVGRHVAPGKPEPALFTETRCASCHPEHRGERHLIARTDTTCTRCHAALRREMPGTPLVDVASFAADGGHPEFAVVAPTAPGAPTCERLRVAAGNAAAGTVPRVEPLLLRAGLRFSHALHLRPGLRTKWADATPGTRALRCADCHLPDAGGATMQPVTFATHCQSCHDLRFADAAPERQVAHPAQPDAVEADLFQFYAARALAGDPTGLDHLPTRRRPGDGLSETERLDALAAARRASAYARDDLLGRHGPNAPVDARAGNRGACAVCHEFGDDGARVLPVRLAGDPRRCEDSPRGGARWMTSATFSHAAHRSTPCERCHRVEDAATSPTGMLPGRAACVGCHRPGAAGAESSLDACIQCHAMHVERYGPGPAQRARAGDPAPGS